MSLHDDVWHEAEHDRLDEGHLNDERPSRVERVRDEMDEDEKQRTWRPRPPQRWKRDA